MICLWLFTAINLCPQLVVMIGYLMLWSNHLMSSMNASMMCWDLVSIGQETTEKLVSLACLPIHLSGFKPIKNVVCHQEGEHSLISEPVNFLCFCVYSWFMTEISELKLLTLCLYVCDCNSERSLPLIVWMCNVFLNSYDINTLDYKT